jgi:hypothetical protein
MGRYRWSQTVLLFPDAPRGPGGRMRRRERAGTTVPADMGRCRLSQPVPLFPDAPRGPRGRIQRERRVVTTVSDCEGHRREDRVRAHVKSQCLDADMGRCRWSQPVPLFPDAPRGPGGRYRWSQPVPLFPDAPRGPGGRMRRRKRARTTVSDCEGHRLEDRVWAHLESWCLGADMGRYRWSQPVLLFPDAPRGPGGRMRRRERAGTTVPAYEGHRREDRVRAHVKCRCLGVGKKKKITQKKNGHTPRRFRTRWAPKGAKY